MILNIKYFALACGVAWAIGIFIFTWCIIAIEGSTHERTFIGRIYRGYTISPKGSLIGALWGFFDGLLGGAVLGFIYNSIVKFIIK